jgi:hypothetical protein
MLFASLVPGQYAALTAPIVPLYSRLQEGIALAQGLLTQLKSGLVRPIDKLAVDTQVVNAVRTTGNLDNIELSISSAAVAFANGTPHSLTNFYLAVREGAFAIGFLQELGAQYTADFNAAVNAGQLATNGPSTVVFNNIQSVTAASNNIYNGLTGDMAFAAVTFSNPLDPTPISFSVTPGG